MFDDPVKRESAMIRGLTYLHGWRELAISTQVGCKTFGLNRNLTGCVIFEADPPLVLEPEDKRSLRAVERDRRREGFALVIATAKQMLGIEPKETADVR